MISFVNAKINIGLNIVGKREDGYHNLETVFFPVGIESGMPQQPEPFDDILELNIVPGNMSGCRFQLMGRRIDCPPEKNLVVKATTLFLKSYIDRFGVSEDAGILNIILDKHIPDGAGLGGGSADASFTLKSLNEMTGKRFSDEELCDMALRLGADCPFFIYNTPCFAEGIGEILTPIELDLRHMWLLIVKPDIHVSTKEAFSGIIPRTPRFDLRFLPQLPVEKWRDYVENDFEHSIFPLYPELAGLKKEFYEGGALYSSMSGSGSSIYGIFDGSENAMKMRVKFQSTYEGVWLFEL